MEIDGVYDIKSKSKEIYCSKYDIYFQSRKLYQYCIRFQSKTKSNSIYSKTCDIEEKDNRLISKSIFMNRLFYYSEIILGIRVFKEYIDIFVRKAKEI